MKKTLLILFSLCIMMKLASAQDFPYSTVTQEEMDMKRYAKDTSAHAVVLQEFGKSRINVGNDDKIKVFYEYHVKIKIFDAKGFKSGTVKIPVYNNSDGDTYESVEDIAGVTFYKDDNGGTQKVELENKKIYPVKETKHLAYYNFALPGLRNGCVIEYKYRIESPYWDDMPHWDFQSDIPKVYSEYEVHIPGFWVFKASMKGYLKLTKNSAEIENRCFATGGASCDCSLLVYGMSDIPAFIEEDYMTSKKDFLSSINFELEEFTNPYTSVKIKWTKEWKDIDYQLKSEDNFGGQVKRKSLFKERILPVIAGKTDELEKAKAVYAYIQKQFKWNEYVGIYSPDGISKAIDRHSGNDADINLALIAALAAAGVNAEPVLLSLRDNGAVNTLYPVINDFDYVIAKVNIGDKSYLLDATEPLLPFGTLPFRCLNDKGRVMSTGKPSYWMDLNLPQKEKSTYTYDLSLQPDGKLKGTIINYYIGYEGYKKRKEIKTYNTLDEYIEKVNAESPKVKISKSEIANLDSLDQPLVEKYEVVIDAFDKLSDRIAFNPFFWYKVTVNPFKLASRLYPVDWGMASDARLILTIHLPENYSIESPPQPVSIGLPNDGGRFITSYDPSPNSFTFSHVIQFNKSTYSSEEYPYLKELYNDIIKSEKAEMVFKKK